MGSEALPLPRALAWIAMITTATACGRISGLDDLYPVGSATTGAASGGNGSGGEVGTGGAGAGASTTTGSGGVVSSGGGCAGGAAPTYPELVLDDSPIAYWRLGETQSELTAKDSSPSGFDASYVLGVERGAPGAIVGDDDKAILFVQPCPDGEEPMAVDLADEDALDFAGKVSFTLEVWIRPSCFDALDTMQRRILYKEDTATGQGWKLNLASDDRLFFTRTGMTNSDYIYGPVPVQDEWSHVVVRYDGVAEQCQIIRNLELAVMPCNASMGATAADFRIGSSTNNKLPFAGSIDEVAIYAGALDIVRIEKHFHTGMATRR